MGLRENKIFVAVSGIIIPSLPHYLFIRHFHIFHDSPYLPPQNFAQPGYDTVPRETENNAYANFWGVNEMHYGKCGNV